MRNLRHLTTTLVVAALLVVAYVATPASDEDCSEWECDVMRKVAGMTEEPDPLTIWNDLNNAELIAEVNPGGDLRDDGYPNILIGPLSGAAMAVWAYNNGEDHDIVFREWTSLGWSPLQFLTSGLVDEVDPRMTIASDGTVHVAWWVAELDQVVLVSRFASTASWGFPRVVQINARRPSVTMNGETMLISFERDRVGGGQEISVLSLEPGVMPVQRVVATTVREEALDARLHNVQQAIWIDWKQSDTSFGFKRLRYGFWDPRLATIPWTDPSWVGQEEVRAEIHSVVLGL